MTNLFTYLSKNIIGVNRTSQQFFPQSLKHLISVLFYANATVSGWDCHWWAFLKWYFVSAEHDCNCGESAIVSEESWRRWVTQSSFSYLTHFQYFWQLNFVPMQMFVYFLLQYLNALNDYLSELRKQSAKYVFLLIQVLMQVCIL